MQQLSILFSKIHRTVGTGVRASLWWCEIACEKDFGTKNGVAVVQHCECYTVLIVYLDVS